MNRLGPYIVVEDEVDGKTCAWVERGGKRISGYSNVDDAREYASLLYEEYVADADVNTGE